MNLSSGGIYGPNDPQIVAGSGGASSCISGTTAADGTIAVCAGGYAKPAWQTGAGVPADGKRDLPDVSLFAAVGTNDSFYPICADPSECVISSTGLAITGAARTSASTPSMAGILALVNQKYGAQGQANFVLYPMAAQHPAAFHDITVGSNDVPCIDPSPDCSLSALANNTAGFDTLGKYYSGAGYDQASGLGSVDANVLITNWNALKFGATKTTLSVSETTFTHGTPVTVSVGVSGTAGGGGGTPSGNVALSAPASATANAGFTPLTLASGAASSSVNNFPGGQYQLTARYGGDVLFAASDSDAVTLNVSPENSTISMFGNVYNYATNVYNKLSSGGTLSYGNYVTVDAMPTGVSAAPGKSDGLATGSVTFTDTSAANGTVSATLPITSVGVAEWVPAGGFLAGAHSVTASYSGDASFNASTSTAPFVFTVTKATTSLQLSGSYSPVPLGLPTPLTLLAVASDTAAPPTGTATFYNGSTVLGTATLGADPYNPAVGQAVLNVSTLPLGLNSVTAKYSGDANNNPATAAPVTISVLQNPVLSATLSPNPSNSAQYFT